MDDTAFGRATFCLSTGTPLFDWIFNSENSFRAAYFRSPADGINATRLLIDALLPRLLAASRESFTLNLTLVEKSLSAHSAKVWLAETNAKICERCAGEWAASSRATFEIVNGRWEQDQSQTAVWGRQAYAFTQLRVFGGFIDNDREYVAERKLNRAKDIHERGWS